MRLEKHELVFPENLLEDAKAELERLIHANADESRTWGYFPGITDANKYSACKALHEELYARLVAKRNPNFSLAFIRVATGKPVSDFGGLHVDVDVGVGHKRTTPHEIERLIINLAGTPRTIHYVDADLKKEGISVSRERYQVLDVPAQAVKTITIPPRKRGEIWTLRFISSKIPHAGITDESGHFLAVYGRYVKEV